MNYAILIVAVVVIVLILYWVGNKQENFWGYPYRYYYPNVYAPYYSYYPYYVYLPRRYRRRYWW